jgi:GTPase SAR1 family protein
MYYRNADAAVLVYDLTDADSFEALQSWYHELQKNVPDCIIVLCGNKLDMETQRKVIKEHAQEYANDKECPLIEVRALRIPCTHYGPHLLTRVSSPLAGLK